MIILSNNPTNGSIEYVSSFTVEDYVTHLELVGDYLVVACKDEIYVYDSTNHTKVSENTDLDVGDVGTMFAVNYGTDSSALFLAGEDGVI